MVTPGKPLMPPRSWPTMPGAGRRTPRRRKRRPGASSSGCTPPPRSLRLTCGATWGRSSTTASGTGLASASRPASSRARSIRSSPSGSRKSSRCAGPRPALTWPCKPGRACSTASWRTPSGADGRGSSSPKQSGKRQGTAFLRHPPRCRQPARLPSICDALQPEIRVRLYARF